MIMDVTFIDPAKPVKKEKGQRYNNESDLSTAIMRKFNAIKNVRCQKVKASVYGQTTLDIVGSKGGRFFWLEVKQPGRKPTMRQLTCRRSRSRRSTGPLRWICRSCRSIPR